MFSIQHLIWLAISVCLIVALSSVISRRRPSLNQILTSACVLAVISESIRLLTYIQMVPSADGSALNLFIEWRHLPLHLCSVQLFLIFYVRFSESERRRETLLAFMYPTCIVGAAFALLLPSIFTNGIEPSEAFTSPIAYQFFSYHSMLVVLGIAIARSDEVTIRFSHLFSTLAILGVFTLLSVYVNSAFAYVTYRGTQLLSVENTPNFFFTYRTPVGIQLTALWQWYVYLAILIALAVVLMTLFYLPFRTRPSKDGASS